MKSYIFGQGTPWSYDQLQQKREIANQLVRGMGAPRNVGEGLNAIGDALLVRGINRRAEKEEARMRDEANALWSQASGGGNVDAIVQALGNPMIANNPGQAAVLKTRLDRAMAPPPAPPDPVEAELRAIELERKRIELEQMRNPTSNVDPIEAEMDAIRLEQARIELERMRNPGPEIDVKGEGDLRREYTQQATTKRYQDQRASYAKIVNAAQDPSPAGDLALIFNYMKILDPGSAVREQEFANAQNAGSVPERIRSLYNNVLEGTRLTPEQRQDFVSTAAGLFIGERDQYREMRDGYRDLAGQYGLDENRAVPNYEPAAPLTSARPQQRPTPLLVPQVTAPLPAPPAPPKPADVTRATPDDIFALPPEAIESLTPEDIGLMSPEAARAVLERMLELGIGEPK